MQTATTQISTSQLLLNSPKAQSISSDDEPRKRKAGSWDDLESRNNSNPTTSALIVKRRRIDISTPDAPALSTTNLPVQRQVRNFERDASIAFIGPRGNGKSSLAVIAATALRREVVDADHYFTQATGMTPSAFRRTHGIEEHRLRQVEVLREMLSRHERDCVIACGPHVVVGKGRELLQNFSRSHAVICVGREDDMIKKCLDLKDQERLLDVIQEMHAIHHQVSNFEYYNLAERWGSKAQSPSEHELHKILPDRVFRRKSFQTLQNTKKDLLSFLNAALGLNSSEGLFRTLHPLEPEMRPNTMALSIPIELIESPSVSLNDFECGLDAVEIVVEVSLPALSAAIVPTTCESLGRSMAVIRRRLAVPVICHFSLDCIEDTQLTPDVIKEYFALLHLGLRFAPEFLTVDLRSPDEDIQSLISSRGRAKIVGNFYDRDAHHGFWSGVKPENIYRRATEVGCHVIRLYRSTQSRSDNFSCLAFMSRMNSNPDGIPVVAYNVGTLGSISSAFNASLTPVTHPLLLASKNLVRAKAASSTAPTITTQEIQQILYATHTLNALSFYVFGADVKYSLSPAVHKAGFQACWMPHRYDIRQCKSLEDVRALIQDDHFGGASISMPFKREILSSVDSLSPSAREIGAVNTLLPIRYQDSQQSQGHPFSKSQRNRAGPLTALHGANTDWMGIYACISRYISPANAPSPRTTSLVIGAGGIARAAIYAMARLGVSNIFILNRTLENAETLAKHYNSKSESYHDSRGSMASSSGTSTAVRPVVHILKSRDDIWPMEYSYPSIVVYTIPTRQSGKSGHRNLRVPEHWLQNDTGGLLVDVRWNPVFLSMASNNIAGVLP
jgi:shikimate 5-dehydrogenase/shikimate kinase